MLKQGGGGAGIRTRVHELEPDSIYMLSLPLIFFPKCPIGGKFREAIP